MTLGELVELIGIVLGLLVFPGIPLAALLLIALWYLFAWLALGRVRIRRGSAFLFLTCCFVLGFVVMALAGCAAHPTHGGWTPAPWTGGATPEPWIS